MLLVAGIVHEHKVYVVGKLDARSTEALGSYQLSNTRVFDLDKWDWTFLEDQHAPEACFRSQLGLYRDSLVLFGGASPLHDVVSIGWLPGDI